MKLLVAAEHLGIRGGMERALEVLLKAFVARGVTVHVVARTIDDAPPGVSAERIAWSDEHDRPDPHAHAAAERVLETFRPDAALAANVMDAGVVRAMRQARRFAYQVHDHRPFCPNGDRRYPRSQRNCTVPMGRLCAVHALTDGCAYGPRPRTLRLIRRREELRDEIARADRVLVASEYVAALARTNRIDAARIREIPPPLPDDAYVDAVEPGVSDTITFAARLVPQKGLSSLVRSLARIPPLGRPVLNVFGDGPALAESRDEAIREGIALRSYGSVTPEAVRRGIDAAALVVVPSLWAEPFGLVGIEAFARARPVVAYDTGGVRSWLRHGENGAIVPAGDEAALAATLHELLADAQERGRLGAQARRDAERYRVISIADAILSEVDG